jgi:hypothetical protein
MVSIGCCSRKQSFQIDSCAIVARSELSAHSALAVMKSIRYSSYDLHFTA